ncbi:GNAT family N-acetyltransferase [Haladaptatus salinisoli]|uniref:GNAT family N-acetyltransferase n=1 Tax=Haladaptatus salinisoli TaxID=2884876 RepID=UPI001D0A9156|nr:GNAT family N-acetyltransferase [Haladaptatus salinisoli]
MTEPRIRRAVVADAEELARAYRSAYRENRRLGFPASAGTVTGRDVAEWVRECRVYVAETEGEVVGGVRLEAGDSNRVKLSRLGVREERKGEGVGGRLLDRAEEAVRDCGYAAVWLTTPEDHPYLPELYRRRGYEKTGEYPLENRSYDEIVMEKRFR